MRMNIGGTYVYKIFISDMSNPELLCGLKISAFQLFILKFSALLKFFF